MEYVDGCSEGLKSAFQPTNYTFNLGGPGGLFRAYEKHPLCWGLLEYCSNLTTTECPLHYISFHRKGGGTSYGVLNTTIDFLDDFIVKFPNLLDIPISNE